MEKESSLLETGLPHLHALTRIAEREEDSILLAVLATRQNRLYKASVFGKSEDLAAILATMMVNHPDLKQTLVRAMDLYFQKIQPYSINQEKNDEL